MSYTSSLGGTLPILNNLPYAKEYTVYLNILGYHTSIVKFDRQNETTNIDIPLINITDANDAGNNKLVLEFDINGGIYELIQTRILFDTNHYPSDVVGADYETYTTLKDIDILIICHGYNCKL